MEKQLYLIEYESAHWAGGSSHVVVRAECAKSAEFKAEEHMQSEMEELYSDEYDDHFKEEDEDLLEQEAAFHVVSIEKFDESHEYWKYFKDPEQSQFFPLVE